MLFSFQAQVHPYLLERRMNSCMSRHFLFQLYYLETKLVDKFLKTVQAHMRFAQHTSDILCKEKILRYMRIKYKYIVKFSSFLKINSYKKCFWCKRCIPIQNKEENESDISIISSDGD